LPKISEKESLVFEINANGIFAGLQLRISAIHGGPGQSARMLV
jgi:hypothetical protein